MDVPVHPAHDQLLRRCDGCRRPATLQDELGESAEEHGRSGDDQLHASKTDRESRRRHSFAPSGQQPGNQDRGGPRRSTASSTRSTASSNSSAFSFRGQRRPEGWRVTQACTEGYRGLGSTARLRAWLDRGALLYDVSKDERYSSEGRYWSKSHSGREAWLERGVNPYDIPNDDRYGDCVCGATWREHVDQGRYWSKEREAYLRSLPGEEKR